MNKTNLTRLRKDYLMHTLSKKDINKDPLFQFQIWFEEALKNENTEANAMVLATVGKNNKPSARVVLLKKIDDNGFVFFTNYESKKANQIMENPDAAILFFWHNLERQVRIEGTITKVSDNESDNYFAERPLGNKIGAIVSNQSKVIPNREYLEHKKAETEKMFENKEIKRPANWGGFCLKPNLFEFWQGRKDRLHDRIQYRKDESTWIIERLAP